MRPVRCPSYGPSAASCRRRARLDASEATRNRSSKSACRRRRPGRETVRTIRRPRRLPRGAPSSASSFSPTAAEIEVDAATTTPRDADTNGSSGEALSVAARAGGSREVAYFQGEFGPAAGLCVVAAASVAGLLGGRLLAVVACLCAWLFAVWIRRRRRLAASTGSKSKRK
ncbi:hypothetical protein ACQ4PT_043359 [Festuca glaucescens]